MVYRLTEVSTWNSLLLPAWNLLLSLLFYIPSLSPLSYSNSFQTTARLLYHATDTHRRRFHAQFTPPPHSTIHVGSIYRCIPIPGLVYHPFPPVDMPAAESSRRASAGHPYARQSASPSPSNSDEVDDSSHIDDANMDDATRAKVARKEARIIRNRESAQRSRNQRKAHVAKLEERVKQLEDVEERLKELEEENAFLRSSSSSSGSPPRSVRHGLALSERGASPALSVASSNLLPYTGGGVNLAAVAPPPRDLDMEMDVKPTLPLLSDDTLAKVQGENAALRDRVARLEELVKHLTPLISLSLPPPTTLTIPADPEPVAPVVPEAPVEAEAFDITAFLDQTSATTPTIATNTTTDGLSTTLSPPYVQPALPLDTNTLARHPAAVATSPSLIGSRESLQRARCTLDLGTEVGRKRMEMAARVVIALAKHRGFRARARNPRCRAGQTQGRTSSRSTWARRWRKDGTRG